MKNQKPHPRFLHRYTGATFEAARLARVMALALLFLGYLGNTARAVILSSEGTSKWVIENRSPQERPVAFAEGEFRDYFEKMSGAQIRQKKSGKDSPSITLGLRRDFTEQERTLLPDPADGFDGYSIYVGEPNDQARILIAGENSRGVVYGAYDLLERMGARFVHPDLDPADAEVVPEKRTLEISPGAWSVASPFEIRSLSWFEWRQTHTGEEPKTSPEELERQIDWAMKSRYNTFVSVAQEQDPAHPFYRALDAADERGMWRQTAGHNFELFFPDDPEFLREHPDWFGMRNGKRVPHHATGSQFCWSNPEAQEYFADQVEAFVEQRPELDILGLYGIDVGRTCQCPKCLKSTPSDNLMKLMNVVTERLGESAPDVRVETIAGYKHSDKRPQKETAHPRLRAQWAAWGRPVTGSYADQYLSNVSLRNWANVYPGRLTAYQYYSDHFAGPWMAAPYARQIEGDRKILKKLGVTGVLNLVYPDGYWWRQTLNGNLAGRALYDPSIDPMALLSDYAQTYYGAAGPSMAAYYEDWAENPRLAVATKSRTQPEHRARLREQREKWLTPAAQAVANDRLLTHRVEKATRLHDLAEKTMDLRLSIIEIASLRQAGHLEEAATTATRAKSELKEVRAQAQSLAERKEGLVADTSFLALVQKRLDGELRALKSGSRKPGPTKAEKWVSMPGEKSDRRPNEQERNHNPEEEQ